MKAMAIPPDLLPNWHSRVDAFDAGAKELGARATSSLQAKEVVLIERPIVSCETDLHNTKLIKQTTGLGGNLYNYLSSHISFKWRIYISHTSVSYL